MSIDQNAFPLPTPFDQRDPTGFAPDPLMTTHRLGHLPILMEYVHKMRVMEIIDEACPVDGRSMVSHLPLDTSPKFSSELSSSVGPFGSFSL